MNATAEGHGWLDGVAQALDQGSTSTYTTGAGKPVELAMTAAGLNAVINETAARSRASSSDQ